MRPGERVRAESRSEVMLASIGEVAVDTERRRLKGEAF